MARPDTGSEAKSRVARLVVAHGPLAAGVVAVFIPFLLTPLAPLTDLPFHTANTSILAHHGDPSFGFDQQFALQPFRVPYLLHYLLAALLHLVGVDIVTASHVAAAAVLSLLPLGLAVLCRGFGKSPWLGLAAVPLAFGTLTHWGFINYVGGLGLVAMAIGAAALTLRRPSRRRQVFLFAVLVTLLATHISRVPVALMLIAVTAGGLYPTTRRVRPVALPVLGASLLFALWWILRPDALSGSMGELSLHAERLEQIPDALFGSYLGEAGEREQLAARWWAGSLLAVAAYSLYARRASRSGTARTRYRSVAAALVPLSASGIAMILFLVLPMEIGIWWYVYPREIVAAVFLALGALPELPRRLPQRLGAAAMLIAGSAPMVVLCATQFSAFGETTADFRRVAEHITEPTPRLCYLIFDHRGTERRQTPFIHLPAYVQAKRGGALSFHFAAWGAAPVVYREDVPKETLPPPFPRRWEWTPQRFRLNQSGQWFTWFLVRSRGAPDALFAADSTIERVHHDGTWWLYRRASP